MICFDRNSQNIIKNNYKISKPVKSLPFGQESSSIDLAVTEHTNMIYCSSVHSYANIDDQESLKMASNSNCSSLALRIASEGLGTLR